MKRKAIYTGSFDPLTLGHLDIIRRGAKLFDELIVAIARNPGKDPMFTPEERIKMIQASIKELDNVSVETFDGLTVEYARSQNCQAILRGIRTYSDFEYEFTMALTNRQLYPELETVYVMTRVEWSYISSQLVKEVARLGGEISTFVPTPVLKELRIKFPGKK